MGNVVLTCIIAELSFGVEKGKERASRRILAQITTDIITIKYITICSMSDFNIHMPFIFKKGMKYTSALVLQSTSFCG